MHQPFCYDRRISDKYRDSELDASFELCPRFDRHELTESQLDALAEKAAERAVEKAKTQLYTGVGHAIVSKALWIVGFVSVAIYIWMLKVGLVKPPIDIGK